MDIIFLLKTQLKAEGWDFHTAEVVVEVVLVVVGVVLVVVVPMVMVNVKAVTAVVVL